MNNPWHARPIFVVFLLPVLAAGLWRSVDGLVYLVQHFERLESIVSQHEARLNRLEQHE